MKNNRNLNNVIEKFIDAYDGTIIGWEVQNMYEGGQSYESICEKMNIDYDEYEEDEYF